MSPPAAGRQNRVMFDDLRLASLAAFVATGLALISFLMLLAVCAAAVASADFALRDAVPLIFVMGTVAGLALGYARWEYANLRDARGGDSGAPR